jgi:ribosome biogenesis protein Tsr3
MQELGYDQRIVSDEQRHQIAKEGIRIVRESWKKKEHVDGAQGLTIDEVDLNNLCYNPSS